MINDISLKWHNRFIEKAKLCGSYSKDPNNKVGAILVGKDKETVCDGYNGFPRGTVDHSYLYEDKEYVLNNMVHAEMNAIANAVRIGSSVKDTILYCTRPPCGRCTGFIKQCGVIAIVCSDMDNEYWLDHSMDDLGERYLMADIPFYILKEDRLMLLSKYKEKFMLMNTGAR